MTAYQWTGSICKYKGVVCQTDFMSIDAWRFLHTDPFTDVLLLIIMWLLNCHQCIWSEKKLLLWIKYLDGICCPLLVQGSNSFSFPPLVQLNMSDGPSCVQVTTATSGPRWGKMISSQCRHWRTCGRSYRCTQSCHWVGKPRGSNSDV